MHAMQRSGKRNQTGEVVAAAARTLSRMRTYVKTAVPRAERPAVLRLLLQLSLEELASMNSVAGEHHVEHVVATLRAQPEMNAFVAVCASRGSALAQAQARSVAARLALFGTATTLVKITTTGDRIVDRPLAAIGSDNLFVKELELALRDGRAAYAVHSCKDLPTVLPEDMRIVAISQREDPRDVFCSERYASFDELPAGARVGTSSLRRRAQLMAKRSDISYLDVRGNVDTRLKKLRAAEYDALILASAGLRRLGVRARYTVPFSTEEMVPAVGQGALAVEMRAQGSDLADRIRSAVNDEGIERAVLCERAALRALQGGCQAPIGIHAWYDGELTATGIVAAPDGSRITRARITSAAHTLEAAQELGRALAARLIDQGAKEIV